MEKPTPYLGYFDYLWYVEVGSYRGHALSNQVRLICFLPVHKVGILLRVDGDSPDASLGCSPEHSDGNLAPVCHQEFFDVITSRFPFGILLGWQEPCPSMEEARVCTDACGTCSLLLDKPFEVRDAHTEHCLCRIRFTPWNTVVKNQIWLPSYVGKYQKPSREKKVPDHKPTDWAGRRGRNNQDFCTKKWKSEGGSGICQIPSQGR